ncbi:class I SAM-dependent methyltransferase [Antarcticimicrobium luteum]|uniref:Class I SAM-dependent methyltransferase n=1 Tax=Antarcticimicrobium luteum TaxID=2547397 RepID=A0A4R5UXV0_9RHOB|nr:class I SAM-dependent methyltransferase [Antarcticimicrobium luteum]TDK43916.1 class I SAM-dependent methyltransferase [Antarcticimicrobium luteum]
MHDDSPETVPPLTLLRTTLALDDALSGLDRAVGDQARLLRSMTELSARIAALADPAAPASADRAGRLKTLMLRAQSCEKQLERAQRTLSAERAAYRAALTDGRDALSRHAALIAGLGSGLETQARKNAALQRTLERQLHRQCQAVPDIPANGFDLPDGSYDYIAIGIGRLLDLLARLDLCLSQDPALAVDGARYRPVSLLEIGCGPGHNLELARSAGLCLFSECSGFDINPLAIATGRAAFDLGTAIEVADALDYDYSRADVIYSFRPFSSFDLQARLEARLAEDMRPGAYLIAPMPLDLEQYPALIPMEGAGEIWRKAR